MFLYCLLVGQREHLLVVLSHLLAGVPQQVVSSELHKVWQVVNHMAYFSDGIDEIKNLMY